MRVSFICCSAKIGAAVKLQTLEKKITLNCRGRLIKLDKPIVMGILNVTPDSFYEGSRVEREEIWIEKAGAMIREGAALLDIGGYSSRPGADDISEKEELERVLPAIASIIKAFPEAIISIDTFRAKVAREAVLAGASLVNDISSGDDDADMIDTIAELKVPYILMHKKGKPSNMQKNPQYGNVVLEVMDYLAAKVEILTNKGVPDLIIDPGFGFGKTVEHNLQLMQALGDFQLFSQPLMVGISRKKMISIITGAETGHALNGTTALNTIALMKGARILRVHDVKEAVECIKLVEAVNGIIQPQ
jgi:dihydropteroate synthase